MSLDLEKVAECRAWLGRAWADLDSASILLGADRPRPDTALFHCQQAAEKAWKAFLFWNDVPFRKTHNLRELGEARPMPANTASPPLSQDPQPPGAG
jgi:HEPN domain-containing protein